jgi:hypothetical protein
MAISTSRLDEFGIASYFSSSSKKRISPSHLLDLTSILIILWEKRKGDEGG